MITTDYHPTIKKAQLEARRPNAILRHMVMYRVAQRGPDKFVVEAFGDHGSWRHIDEFRTRKEADARKVKLEQIFERANRDIIGDGR